MLENANAVLGHLARQAESKLQSQVASARRQTTLRGVVSALHPQVPGYLRSLLRSTAAYRELQPTCERVAKSIISKQLAQISALPQEEATARFNRLYTTEWLLLRGNFPRLAQQIERERLVRLTKAGSTTTPE